MRKSIFGTIIASTLIFSVTVAVFAQPTFFGGGSTSKQPPGPPSNQVMSPEDFNNTIATLKQQSQDSLKQQLNQQLKKSPAIPTPGSNANGSPETPTNDVTPTPAASAPPSLPPTPTLPTQQRATPVTPPAATTGNNTPSNPGYNPGLGQSPTQSQPYTGFGSGNTEKAGSSGSSTKSSSGGWNIKY